MKTIVISDMAFLGVDYNDAKKGLLYLKDLQRDGYKIIVLSNRPEYCMRKIGVYSPKKQEVTYHYLGAETKKGFGISVEFLNGFKTFDSVHLQYDYTIFGNGIKIYNCNDEMVYEGEYIKEENLKKLVQSFRALGFLSYGESSYKQDEFQDRCFKSGENIYKFFEPEIGTTVMSKRVYGMQCSSISYDKDIEVIKTIERENEGIKGYYLNQKPCFYRYDVNKLSAFQYLLQYDKSICLENTSFLLSEPTDQVIKDAYPNLSHYISQDMSLVRSLTKLK